MNDLFTVQRDERAHNLVSEGNALDAACCINTDLQQPGNGFGASPE
ncbi:hypothetical protein ACT89R_30630 (plasmid) [Rhodococcus qingshengii]